MKKAEDFYIKLEKRAYQTIDKIESGRDQSAKYEYLEIMTMLAFFILDSLRALRTCGFLFLGAALGILLTLLR